MKRSAPARKTSIRSTSRPQSDGGPRPKSTPGLRARSEGYGRFYRTKRNPLLVKLKRERGDRCELRNVILLYVGRLEDLPCTVEVTGLHERRGRGQVGSLLNEDNVLLSCSGCNHWVEDNPDAARELGLKVSAGMEEFDDLAAPRRERK